MKRIITLYIAVLFAFMLHAQQVQRPKLVVGLVVDQMRWDYLYRYADRYAANGGFKKMLGQGFSCENTMIPYTPTVTACGHSSIYTGSVPAINGITGNLWWDYDQNREVYCTEDKSVTTVGTNSSLGQMSPKNLLVTTVCDELRLATNFKSKVIGIALKDRGGILTAGHSANGAYWYDNTTGDWITSTYYMNILPSWVKDFNAKKWVNQYYQQGWATLYPINTYMQSTEDEKSYEGKPFGASAKAFPYDMKAFIGKNYSAITSMPQGNTLTAEFAKAAILGEKLGSSNNTDMLAVSFSSPDYIGHAFGPNSIEEEDNYLRLDKEIGDFLDFLDNKIGKGQYLVFLSADHGVAHVPGFLKEHNLPAGNSDLFGLAKQINDKLKTKFGLDNIIVSADNYQFYLDHRAIDSAGIKKEDIKKMIINLAAADSKVARAFDLENLSQSTLVKVQKEMFTNGYYPKRSGDIQIVLQPQVLDGFSTAGTTHGLWNPYDAHIPLVWYGWGIKPGKTNKEVYMTDIAPTIAAILHIQMPNGCIGKPIEDVIKQ